LVKQHSEAKKFEIPTHKQKIITNQQITITMNKKILFDKLFPKYNGVDLQKLLIDDQTMTYITTPYHSRIIAQKIKEHLIVCGIDSSNACICDATACVGGDSITFSMMFNKVISIEINDQWYGFLKNNVEQYKLKNVTIICGNAVEIIPSLTGLDAIYVDPPWGGRDYKSKVLMKIRIGDKKLELIVTSFFELIGSRIKLVAVKLPKNYDLKYFYSTIKSYVRCKIYCYQLNKMNLLIVQYDGDERLIERLIDRGLTVPISSTQEIVLPKVNLSEVLPKVNLSEILPAPNNTDTLNDTLNDMIVLYNHHVIATNNIVPNIGALSDGQLLESLKSLEPLEPSI
jgi:hypothetical protein